MKLMPVLLSFWLVSCGYQWGNYNRSLPGGHKTIFIELFKNQSSEVGAEAFFTQGVKEEFLRSGLVLVTTPAAAEVILKGSIINVENINAGSDPRFVDETTGEAYQASYFTVYNLRVTSNLKLVRSRDEKVIWQTQLIGEENYRGSLLKKQGIRSSNVLYNQSRRQQTMKLIAKKMMQEAFDRLTERF